MKARIEAVPIPSLIWLTADFAQNQPALPGLQSFRLEQLKVFLSQGLPTRKDEAWKYTDVSFLAQNRYQWPAIQTASAKAKALIAERAQHAHVITFINGHFSTADSILPVLPPGTIISTVREALAVNPELVLLHLLKVFDAKRYPLAALNAACMSDGLFVYLPKNADLTKPLHTLFIADDNPDGFMAAPRQILILEEDSCLTYTEEYVAFAADHYFLNPLTEIYLGKKAQLNFYQISNQAPQAKQTHNILVHQQERSHFKACSFLVGGQLTRNELTVNLAGSHAVCTLAGFYGLDQNGQVIDNHLHVEHLAPHTKSDMNFRGILAQSSRAVFNGKALVRQEAKHSEAQQLNHNLLLSPMAEVDTKPDLEIYTDEVACRHGATVGQLDEDQVFYLCSRGIDRKTATNILLQAFLEDIFKTVHLPELVTVMRTLWSNAE